jgi:hypothetical protein
VRVLVTTIPVIDAAAGDKLDSQRRVSAGGENQWNRIGREAKFRDDDDCGTGGEAQRRHAGAVSVRERSAGANVRAFHWIARGAGADMNRGRRPLGAETLTSAERE